MVIVVMGFGEFTYDNKNRRCLLVCLDAFNKYKKSSHNVLDITHTYVVAYLETSGDLYLSAQYCQILGDSDRILRVLAFINITSMRGTCYLCVRSAVRCVRCVRSACVW